MPTVIDLINRFRDPETGDPRHHTLAWELHVAGMGERTAAGDVVEWRWVSSPVPADTANVRYFDAIEKIGGYRAKLDGFQGITAVGGTRVDLLFVDHPDNRAGQLCRTEASWSARLGVTLYGDTAPPFDLDIARGFEHFDEGGGIFHIGQEAFEYDGVDDEAETVHVVARSILGTIPANHIVDPTRGQAPTIYPEPIYWADRPATLWKTVLEPDGSRFPVSIEHAGGYLVGLPDNDALKCWFTITPWLGNKERKIGDSGAVARLVQGWKVVAHDDPGRHIEFFEGYAEGAGYEADALYDPLGDGDVDVMLEAAAAMHAAAFDFQAPSHSALHGRLRVASANIQTTYAVANVETDEDVDKITVTRPFEGLNQNAGRQTLVNTACELRRELDIRDAPGAVAASDGSGAAAVPWPSGVVRLINTRLVPTSARNPRAGHIPGFLDIRVSLNAEPQLRVQSVSGAAPVGPELRLKFGDDPQRLWYGLDFADPGDPNHALPAEQTERPERLWPADRVIQIQARPQGWNRNRGPITYIPIRSVKGGHWQTGQRWIHVDRGDWPAPPFQVLVKSKWGGAAGFGGEREMSQTILIDDVVPAGELFDGVPGHLLMVFQRHQWRHHSFGDELMSPGEVTVQAVPLRDETPIPQFLVWLLCSINGRRTNEYDVLPGGAAIPPEAVDAFSFSNFYNQQPLQFARVKLGAGMSLREIVTPLLTYLGAMLVTHLDPEDGRRKIRLIRAGVAVPAAAAEHINDQHWFSEPPVLDEPDRRVMTGIDWHFNYDADDKPTGRLTASDDEQTTGHRQRDRIQKVELRGVVLPGDPASHEDALLGPTLAKTEVYGRERRIIKGRVPHARVGHLDVGAELYISHNALRGPDGNRTIIWGRGRVVEFTDDPDEGRASIAVDIARGHARPIPPALRLIEVIDAVTCRVERNRYTKDRNINPFDGTEQVDLDMFRLQQRVRVGKRTSARDSVHLRIIAIDRDNNLVVFDGAHGLSNPFGGQADIPAYPLADPIDQQRWAFQELGHTYA